MKEPFIDEVIDRLDSEYVAIEYRRGEKQIFARDLRDTNNEPAIYTTRKRGLDKVWALLTSQASGNLLNRPLTLSDVMNACQTYGVKYHYWCMVD